MCSVLLLLNNILLKLTNDVLKTWLFPQNLSSLLMKSNSIVSKILCLLLQDQGHFYELLFCENPCICNLQILAAAI